MLLVTGFGRSGTTLVNTILGSTPGVFAAGEVRFLWERGLIQGRQCGCGQPLEACPVWGPVLEKAFGGATEIDAARLVAEDATVMRTRQLPWMLASRFIGDRLMSRLDTLPDALTAVYRSIQEVTGAELIVDTSKPPSFGYVLQHLDGIDLRILHVVRDPRAVAYSWTRTKALTDGGDRTEMLRLSPPQSALQWDLWNGAAGWLWGRSDRYLRMRYEDLAARPVEAMARIAAFAGVPDLALPFTDAARRGHHDRAHRGRQRGPHAHAARSPSGSTTPGRPSCLPATRRLVTALTLPLLARYRYPVAPARPPTSS